jgi:hypothetical protein
MKLNEEDNSKSGIAAFYLLAKINYDGVVLFYT